jgi:hypothetical protein
MYFMRMGYPVKGSIAFLLSFYDQCCHDMQTVDVLLMLFLFSLHQKSPPFSLTTSVGFAALMLTATNYLLSSKGLSTPPSLLPSSSLSSSIMMSTQQLFVETPRKSTKLPSHLINWLSIEDIRRKLEKHNKQKVTANKIEEDVSSLLSKFAPGEIRFAQIATLAKLELILKISLHRKVN